MYDIVRCHLRVQSLSFRELSSSEINDPDSTSRTSGAFSKLPATQTPRLITRWSSVATSTEREREGGERDSREIIIRRREKLIITRPTITNGAFDKESRGRRGDKYSSTVVVPLPSLFLVPACLFSRWRANDSTSRQYAALAIMKFA